MFTTMGGQSRCPGESGTLRRESGVRIVTIKPRCGADGNSPCTPVTLTATQTAKFGVIIENLSPTGDEVYYTLQFADRFEAYQSNSAAYQTTSKECGTPGSRNFLIAAWQETDLQRIPYNLWIESPFTATATWSNAFCSKWVDVKLRIIATCEQPQTSRKVYQYGFKWSVDALTTISYDEADRMYALNSTATFSVQWPTSTIRRLLQSDHNTDSAVSVQPSSDDQKAYLTLLMKEQKYELLELLNQRYESSAQNVGNEGDSPALAVVVLSVTTSLLALALIAVGYFTLVVKKGNQGVEHLGNNVFA